MTKLLDDFELNILEKSSVKLDDSITDLIKLVSAEIEHADTTSSKILGLEISASKKQLYLDNWINTDLKQALNGLKELKVKIINSEQIFSTVKIEKWKTCLANLEDKCELLWKLS